MNRRREHYAEEMLRAYSLQKLTSAQRVRGLGYANCTVEARLVRRELVGIKGTPRAITPEVFTDPQLRDIALLISANVELYDRLVYWLYGYPLMVPCDKGMTSLVRRYSEREGVGERQAWNRRKRLLDAVVQIVSPCWERRAVFG